jgi:hypothetical protein
LVSVELGQIDKSEALNMARLRKHDRIPDDVTDALKRAKKPQPLWYVGSLQAENGHDLLVEPVPEDKAVKGARAKPPPARRPKRHPDNVGDDA